MAEIVFGSVDGYGNRRSPDEVRIIREILDDDINRFVTDSSIDAPAANELRCEPAEIQWAVLQRGPVRSASNPSAALVGRIRDAKRMKLAGGGPGLAPLALPPPGSAEDLAMSEVDKRPRAVHRGESLGPERIALPEGGQDDEAEPLDVQKTVMAQGPLTKCYNPSGALMGRVRAARLGQRAYVPSLGDGPAGPAPVDERVSEEARKAIGKLQAPSSAAPAPLASLEDGQLQEEALKAIKSLGASEDRPLKADIIY